MCEVPPPLVVQHLAQKELKKSIKHYISKPQYVSVRIQDFLFHFNWDGNRYKERVFRYQCFENFAHELLSQHLKANPNEIAMSIQIPVEFNSFKYIVLFEKRGERFIVKTHEFVNS